ncbi:hypothetical protein AwWohl_01060 [Gammaproteobacteria bacterium]|nr:hypothetical protein AwWohl_01060 [Gammaproteobacteria bacterium]
MYNQLSLSELDQKLNILVNRGFVPAIAYSLIDQRKIIHQNAIGFSAIHTKVPIKIKSHSHFRASSITNLIVCLAVLRMQQQQLLDIDENISTYLGYKFINPKFKDIPITLRQLLTHTSSIRDGENAIYTAPNNINLFDLFKLNKKNAEGAHYYDNASHFDLKRAPGSYFCYSNLNFGVIATVLEKIMQLRFDVLMQEFVINPLELTAIFNSYTLDEETRKTHTTLYRKCKNSLWDSKLTWQIQKDQFLEVNGKFSELTPQFDEKSYKIGHNASCFFGDASLRINLQDTTKIALLLAQKGVLLTPIANVTPVTYEIHEFLTPESFQLLTQNHWKYDVSLKADKRNGDTFNGLIKNFGLSNIQFKDHEDSPFGDEGEFWFGHNGEEHGLISGLYCNPKKNQAIFFAITGLGIEPEIILPSGLYQIEKYILAALFDGLKTYEDRDI